MERLDRVFARVEKSLPHLKALQMRSKCTNFSYKRCMMVQLYDLFGFAVPWA